MKIVIDTNVVVDVLARREPFFEHSEAVVRFVAVGRAEGAITANTVTDLYYLLCKHMAKDAAKTALRGLMDMLSVVAVTENECLAALDLPMNDYKDALLASCAKSWAADVIITSDMKDFAQSSVKAMAPADFVMMMPPE